MTGEGSLLLIFSVLSGCTALDSGEYFGVVMRVRNTGQYSGFWNGTGGILKIFQAALNAVLLDITKQGDVHTFFEKAAAFAGT